MPVFCFECRYYEPGPREMADRCRHPANAIVATAVHVRGDAPSVGHCWLINFDGECKQFEWARPQGDE